MTAWNQKRRDPAALAERRIRGVKMIVDQGLSEHEVARQLGVSQGAVSMWYAAYKNGVSSYDALTPRKQPVEPQDWRRDISHRYQRSTQRARHTFGSSGPLDLGEGCKDNQGKVPHLLLRVTGGKDTPQARVLMAEAEGTTWCGRETGKILRANNLCKRTGGIYKSGKYITQCAR